MRSEHQSSYRSGTWLSEVIEVPLAVADAGYGDAAAFRHGVQARDMHYVVGISSTMSAQPGHAVPVTEPYSGNGRPPVAKYPDKPVGEIAGHRRGPEGGETRVLA